MNAFKLSELKPDYFFTDDLLLDRNFLLLGKYIPITPTLIKQLKAWNFARVFSKGRISNGTTVEDDLLKEELENRKKADEALQKEKKQELNTSLENASAQIQAQSTEEARLETIRGIYKQYSDYIDSLYTRYATHKEIDRKQLSKIVSELIRFCSDNHRFVLRINPPTEQTDKKFMVNHAMRSTVIAITVGMRLHLTFTQLSELSEACILHEIGMLRLPPQLYITDKKLQPQEKAKLASHPILGYDLLKSLGFEMPIQRAVLEHHEKENGSGYPRHISSQEISTYAKIISVACAFEAITAPRHYRSARPKYEAMLEILHNKDNQYDRNVIKALLFSFSIFPIGVYVYLQNGKVAQIIDTKDDDPKHPIAQILGERSADGDMRTVDIDEESNKVVRVLNQNEVSDVMASLGLTAD